MAELMLQFKTDKGHWSTRDMAGIELCNHCGRPHALGEMYRFPVRGSGNEAIICGDCYDRATD